MPVFMIIEIEIQDGELYAQYVEEVPPVIERYGGRYLARGGRVTPLAGNWHPERVIVIEFDTLEQVRQCFASPEYLALAPLRERSTRGRSIVVEGCAHSMVDGASWPRQHPAEPARQRKEKP
jgi:uncharacterized protein (DUF1330 family)